MTINKQHCSTLRIITALFRMSNFSDLYDTFAGSSLIVSAF